MSDQFKRGDWSELKRLAEAAQSTFGSFDPSEAEFDLMAAITPDVILALIAENEGMVGRIRFFELVHGGRASEVFHQMSVLHDEVRRLKILAGEDVPPLPEEFVGPLLENCNARLRRKLRDLNAAPKVPASLVFPPIEQQTAAGDAGATENYRYNEKLQNLACAVNSAMHAAGMPVDADPAELADVIHGLQIQVATMGKGGRSDG